MTKVLRPYQNDAIYQVCRKWVRHDRVLISMPTGSGKSVCGSYLAGAWIEHLSANHGLPPRVLWLAHRDELIDQACEHCEDATGEPAAVEKGERSIARAPSLTGRPVVVSSIQTMLRPNRREFFPRNAFGLIVLDECHHIPGPSYQEVLDYFQPIKLVGMTATCDRADEVPLGKFFDATAYHYDVLDCIQDGWLCNIKQQFVKVEQLDWSKVRQSGGDWSATDLDEIIAQEEVIHSIVAPSVPMVGDRQTLVFAPSVNSAKAIAGVLPRYTKAGVAWVSGETDSDERRAIVEDFRAGRIQWLVGCMVFIEGFDAPATSCIVVARPTQSRMLFAQMIGRGLRGGWACPVPGKEDCLVIDLVGASMQHNLRSTADVFAGKFHAEVADEAARRIYDAAGDGPVDVLDEVLKAQADEDEIRAANRRKVIAEAKATRTTVDPFLLFAEAVELSEIATPGWWKDLPPDNEQKEKLGKLGIPEKGLDFGQARQLINEATRRSDEGLCTYKQAGKLRPRGFAPNMTLAEASDVMTHLASRPGGWKFGQEDGIRVARVKKRGRPFEYHDLRVEYTVGLGVECMTRIEGHDWMPYETRKATRFNSVATRTDDGTVFKFGKHELHVKRKDYGVRILGWR